MNNRVLGVVCVIVAALLHTAERIARGTGHDHNSTLYTANWLVIVLVVLSAVFLVASLRRQA